MNKNIIKISVIILILLSLFSFGNTRSVAQVTPNPVPKFVYKYDSGTDKITEYDYNSTRPTGRTFSQPVGLDMGSVSGGNGPECPGGENAGLIAFKLDQTQEPIYLLSTINDSKTCGLFYKNPENYYFSNLELSSDGKLYTHTTGQLAKEYNLTDTNLVTYIGQMNGMYKDGAVLDASQRYGIRQVANDLVQSQKITESTILCGNISVGSDMFNKNSVNYDKLPNDIKAKIDSGTISIKDILDKTKLFVFLKYSNGYDANSNYRGWTNASFGSQNFKIPVNSDGSFQSENLKGLPVGKYKITGVMYLRNDNPTDTTTKSRFDSPETGWWKDFLADFTGVKDGIDIYQITPVFEVNVAQTGNTAKGFKTSSTSGSASNCMPLTYRFGATQDTYSIFTSENDNKKCDGGGTSVSAMIKQGLCGLTVVLKDWADKAFKWALNWMQLSIGLVNNESTNVENTTDTANVTSTGTVKFIADPGTSGSSVGPASQSLYNRFKANPSTIAVGIWPASSATDASAWGDSSKKIAGKLISSEFTDSATYPTFKFKIGADKFPDTEYALVAFYQSDSDNNNYDGTYFLAKVSDLKNNSGTYNSFPYRNQ